MASNTVALMAALSEGDAPFSNPHHWTTTLGGYSAVPQNQYAYTIEGVQGAIRKELQILGVDQDSTIVAPPDIGAEWTLTNNSHNKNNVYRYIINAGGEGESDEVGLFNSDDSTNIAKAMTLDDLYLLANNLVWCYHNLVSFSAYTDFTSGYYQYSDRFQNEHATELEYIPTYIPELANSFSHFSQFLSLASYYNTVNTTINAHATIYTAINATSIHVISNNATFHANTNMYMNLGKGPTMNVMAMWLYTANGVDEINSGSGVTGFSRPAGLARDLVYGKEAYNEEFTSTTGNWEVTSAHATLTANGNHISVRDNIVSGSHYIKKEYTFFSSFNGALYTFVMVRLKPVNVSIRDTGWFGVLRWNDGTHYVKLRADGNPPSAGGSDPDFWLSTTPDADGFTTLVWDMSADSNWTGDTIDDIEFSFWYEVGTPDVDYDIDSISIGTRAHPAESMTPKEVCNEFIRATNVYTYMVRSYLTDSRPAGDYDPLPGVTPANTFIYEARDWLAKRAKAQGLIDLMSRTTLPGATSTAIQNALANTGT